MAKSVKANVDVKMAMAPVLMDVGKMKPHPKNPNRHPDSQVAGIGDSMREFGMLHAIVVDEKGRILSGEGRYLTALREGVPQLPAIRVDGWSEEKKLAFMLADNRWAQLSQMDQTRLREVVGELQRMAYDIKPIGYSLADIGVIMAPLANAGEADPDEVGEPPKVPVTRRGDLWILGEHRLLCGDCTDADDVQHAVDTHRPNLMVSDPPYGVNYDPNWRNEAPKWKGSKVKLGASAIGRVMNDKNADWSAAWLLFSGDVAYVWHAALFGSIVEQSLKTAGLVPRSHIIWNKTRGVIGRGNYHWQHEPCWYVVREGKTARWNGSRTETTVWDIPKSQTSETGHGTQKPVECMKRPIENNSKPGDWVYDPFVGSGTTIIAAEMTGRRAIALEIDPAYCDVTIERWQKFSGKVATLDGVPFNEVAKARKKGKAKGRKINAKGDTGKPVPRRKRAAGTDPAVA